MPISSFFFDAASRPADFVQGIHHPGLVLLSILVSVFSSAMAMQTAKIARYTEDTLYRHIAISTGAVALGGGIWTMHFIGMLAFELPAELNFHTGLTLSSLIPACGASWLALRILAMPTVSARHLAVSGTLVGLGIGAMHYIGMSAIRTPLTMHLEPAAFVMSLVVAIVLAILALWVRFGLSRTQLSRMARIGLSSLVMGLAIAGMHYTGMAAVYFVGEPGVPEGGLVLNATYAALILSSFTITVSVMVLAVNGLIRSHELYGRLDAGSSRLRATLDTAVDGIITIDSKGLIQEFNRSAERLFGWTAREVLGRNISMLMPEPFQSMHDGFLQNYHESGKAKIIGIGREVVGLRKDGSHMPMRLAVGRVDLPGELLFVGFVTDISDRHALEQSLRETAERAELAAAAKSTFVANISHEIRTPMNSIIGFTELLLETELTAVQRRHLETVRQASRSLLRLINDILDTTKMEKGRLELEATHFSMKAVAAQVDSSLRLAAQSKHLVLATYYPEEMPEFFQGDPLRVQQILTNLVGNAIKFTESGSVDVVFAHDADIVHIQVRDTGIGMTPEQVETIFAPFTQADASISRRFGGTGLGTTIARQLVELMRGDIEVESQPGFGSTFHVRLPLPVGQRGERPEAAEGPVSLPPLRVLIADDVPQNLMLLRLILEREGHAVIQAQDGAEAVEQFVQGGFDVVLMDVQMPGTDGLEATRRIREHERTRAAARTPIIALTASVMLEDRRAAREAGMDGFAWKPLEARRLFAEIARVLNVAAEPASGAAIAQPALPVADEEPIDWQGGMALWGSREKLADALRQFLDTAQQRYPLWGVEGDGLESEKLHFSLHGLKGAAGNLALPAVARQAGELDEQLREGRRDTASSGLHRLQARLDDVRRALADHDEASLPPSSRRSPTPLVERVEAAAAGLSAGSSSGLPAGVPTAISTEIPAELRELADVLGRNELDDGLLDKVCAWLNAADRHQHACELRAAVAAFEFREACKLLQRLTAESACDASSRSEF